MPRDVHHASRFLHANQAISTLLAEIERNAAVLASVRAALPAPLDSQCRHAVLDGETLVLTTESPAWSSLLRFHVPEIERALAGRVRFTSCRIRVLPASVPPPAGGPYRLSEATVGHLEAAAAQIADEGLARALRRLARAGAGAAADQETANGRR